MRPERREERRGDGQEAHEERKAVDRSSSPGDAFEYAVLRIVPKVERGEAVNVGVVVFCRTRGFLDARIELGSRQLAALGALDAELEIGAVRSHLEEIERIVAGDAEAGPIAKLAAPERFRWVTSPSSTVIQPSGVHGGMTEDPAKSLSDLFDRLVR